MIFVHLPFNTRQSLSPKHAKILSQPARQLSRDLIGRHMPIKMDRMVDDENKLLRNKRTSFFDKISNLVNVIYIFYFLRSQQKSLARFWSYLLLKTQIDYNN